MYSGVLGYGDISLIHTTFVTRAVKHTIHDATCNMQLAACNRIASCVLEMLCVACSVKLFHANRIVVYSMAFLIIGSVRMQLNIIKCKSFLVKILINYIVNPNYMQAVVIKYLNTYRSRC